TVPVFVIVPEWPARREPYARVQRLSRHKRRVASSFEIQHPIAASASHVDDVIQECSTRASPAPSRRRAHRFDLSLCRRKLLERGATGKQFPIPCRPEGDVEGFEFARIEGEYVLRWGELVHVPKMLLQQ